MNITAQAFEPLEIAADALIVPVQSADKSPVLGETGTAINDALGGALSVIIADTGYTGAQGRVLSMATVGRIPARRVVLAGLGSGTVTPEAIRRGYGAAVQSARDSGARRVAVVLPDGVADAAEFAVEGALLSTYRFSRYFGKARSEDQPLKEIDDLVIRQERAHLAPAMARGQARAAGINLARDLSNEPGSVLHPVEMVERSMIVAADQNLEIKVLGPGRWPRWAWAQSPPSEKAQRSSRG